MVTETLLNTELGRRRSFYLETRQISSHDGCDRQIPQISIQSTVKSGECSSDASIHTRIYRDVLPSNNFVI